MLSRKDVTDLYKKYGFESGPETESYLVFFSQHGYFQNAEIVLLRDDVNVESINKREYEDLGYSIRVRRFSNIKSVHDALFDGFFSTTLSNKRLMAEYKSFCDQQSRKLGGAKYEYIGGSFVEDGELQEGLVIDKILGIFSKESRQLIILEASAGFGKTCTSFEVIRRLIERDSRKIPLLTELSKNRKASVFRYVLLTEIDQKFPTLSSDLVTSEIQDGRIFLIVDGFDELLSKSCSPQQDSEKGNTQDAQTMLDTITQLIPEGSRTKILLTSRKSSIFAGDSFTFWANTHLRGCDITRLQLTTPSLREWLGPEKLGFLKSKNFVLNRVSNPVLLTLLRSKSIAELEKQYASNDDLIKEYLGLLLQREKTRQAIPLDAGEQLFIMQGLAALMVRYDISAEDVDFIKSLVRDVIESNLKDYLARYDTMIDASEEKPTEAEFLTKLSHHALLDRVSTQNNLIGFINEFIFGLLIAESVVSGHLSRDELKGKYLDIAVTAFAACNPQKRKALYDVIEQTLPSQTAERQLDVQMHLLGTVSRHYVGEYFDALTFIGETAVITPSTFRECIFSNCIFDKCKIARNAFEACQFYNCTFYEIDVKSEAPANKPSLFVSCPGAEGFNLDVPSEKPQDNGTNYERVVLEQFWKPGSEAAELHRAYQSLFRGFLASEFPALANAVESLEKKRILIKRLNTYQLNPNKMSVIRKIVER